MAEGLKGTQENRNAKIPIFIDSEESIPIVRRMQGEFIYGRRGPVHNPYAHYRQPSFGMRPRDP